MGWKKIHIAYALAFLSFVLLFFTGRYETGFSAWFHGPGDMLTGLSLHKIVLTLFDVSLLAIIITPGKNDDERVEKIRSFAIKQTFIIMLITVTGLGLLIPVNFSILIYVAIIEVYYLFLFELYLYRDSRIVYLTAADHVANYKANKKNFIVYIVIQSILLPIILIVIPHYFHRPDLFWLGQAAWIGIVAIGAGIYSAWKK